MQQKLNTAAIKQARSEFITQIKTVTPVKPNDLSAIMSAAFGGTDASGAWHWRMAYDVMQSAALSVARKRLAGIGSADPASGLDIVNSVASLLPTETRRSERQMQLQQFSTALDWGWVAAAAANVQTDDVILEPSAGTGCLAGLATAGQGAATLVMNELDPLRRHLLDLGFEGVPTAFDAEFIDDRLGPSIAPTVVLMNPPFASSLVRSADPSIAIRHVISAAKRLRVGGRLVAIVPPNVSARGNSALWERLCKIVTPQMRLELPRSAFRRMGTTVETHILTAERHDGGGSANAHSPSIVVANPTEALAIVAEQLPARATCVSSQQREGGGIQKRDVCDNDTGVTSNPMNRVAQGANTLTRAARMSKPNRNAFLTPKRMVQSDVSDPIGAALVPVGITGLTSPRVNEAVSDVYARYKPQRMEIDGAQHHPTPLVESLAMASVAPPVPATDKIDLRLPSSVVRQGLLSEAQLETLAMAESAFASDLPGRFTIDEDNRLLRMDDNSAEGVRYRKGYFLGDGTGCGKGRQVAGVILAGWNGGRRKAVWVSKSTTLLEDAKRDWSDLGGAPTDIHAVSRWSADEDIKLQHGILFVTYATLRAASQKGRTRLEQVLSWLGDEFDGVIAFDEAHAMQNAGGGGTDRGAKKPSQQGLAGLRLQNAVPRARVLYVSATGATEVSNLAYASRLGLWGTGEGYPFASRDQFVSAMEAGGVAAMEVVARDLKAMGLYTARALSFEGVEYDVFEHQLSEDQITIYDTWARAFATIHRNLHAALEATGITSAEGSSETGSGSAKAAAMSAFESCKQRFFGHLLQGMKAPAVIEAIQSDIDAGWAPVVQIVSTGEALLKRRLEGLAPDEELTQATLTPREYVVGYLQNAFPVTQMQLIEQEDGSVLATPLRDDAGNAVISREAELLRNEVLEELMLLAPIPSALDQLIWAFGADKVAEVTGRSQRPIKDGAGRLRVERRSGSSNSAETAAFMNGEKDILIFSDAGGTGRSYQAATSANNQKRRRHYLLEPGWRADNAIQGLGRTHRAAQVSAPFFRVCTTDVHGEKRFTSTIARRLDTLGALTKGQRETASQGMFRAEDNLESPIARGCLRALYRDIVTGTNAPIDLDTFTHWTGLRLTCKEGQLLDELPPIQRFLNRILALPIAMQNAIFSEFMERIATATERARVAGTLDVGLEQLRGDSIVAGDPETLRTDETTGAVTSLIPLDITTAKTYQSAQSVRAQWPRLQPMHNASSGKVGLIATRPRHAYGDDGELVLERRIIRPAGESWIEEGKFTNSHWEGITAQTFATLWDAEVEQLPSVEERQLYLLSGLILPIWQSIPGEQTRIYRATTDEGVTYLGRALNVQEAGSLRAKHIDIDVTDPEAILEAVQIAGQQVEMPIGLSLVQRRVAGHMRLEVIGANKITLSWLRSLGCFTEIHQFTLRVFIPQGDGVDALKVVRAICGAGAEKKEAA